MYVSIISITELIIAAVEMVLLRADIVWPIIIWVSLLRSQHTNMHMQITFLRNSAKQYVFQLMTLLPADDFRVV
jgi:hypothetical protein